MKKNIKENPERRYRRKIEKVPNSTQKVVKKSGKKKAQKTDGLGPREIKQIRAAIRLVWQRSLARKLVVLRCTDKDGFMFCEKCGKRVPKIFVNHIDTVGDVDEGFIERMFCPSMFLEGLCKPCHDPITKLERKAAKARKLSV